MIKAVLLGGLGVIAESSEQHRQAFNMVFQELKLPIYWSLAEYQNMLHVPGGHQRIARYLNEHYPEHLYLSETIHQLKGQYFQFLVKTNGVTLRPGVLSIIQQANDLAIPVIVTSTTQVKDINAVLLNSQIDMNSLAQVFSDEDVSFNKPSPEIYKYACKVNQLTPESCIAIEDSGTGVESAYAAGVPCYAFPGENTKDHNYEYAISKLSTLDEIDLISGYALNQEMTQISAV